MLKAGAGKEEIIFPEGFLPLENFKCVKDPLFCRVIIVEANLTFLFVSLEVTSLQEYAISEIKKRIQKTVSIPKEHIFMSVTHTFSAPHTRSLTYLECAEKENRIKNENYLSLLLDKVEHALKAACKNLQPVTIKSGVSQFNCNVNRDIETDEGFWLGKNDEGYSNKEIPFVTFVTDTGEVLALIYSIDVQSSVVSVIDRHAISSDFVGLTSQAIEKDTGMVALYMLGAAADQTVNLKEYTEVNLRKLATNLSNHILEKLKRVEMDVGQEACLETLYCAVRGQEIRDKDLLKPTKYYNFIPSKEREVEVDILSLGSLVLVMMKPEINSMLGREIKNHSPYLTTIVTTMINGGQKYMVDKASYMNCTYESMNSLFACGSAEIVVEAIVKKLKEMR